MEIALRERVVARLSEPRPSRKRAPRILEPSFSAVGLVLGLFFFAISLTPSLLPRAGYAQGINSGVAFMVGYGIGTAVFAVYRFLGIPRAKGHVRIGLIVAAMALIGFQAALAIWAYVGWQNQVRLSFGMEPLSPLVWPVIVVVAAAVAAVLLIIARSLRTLFMVRQFGNDQKIDKEYKAWGGNGLKLFPPKEGEDAVAALDELVTVYKANFEEFAKNARTRLAAK